jgi:hypothetical protein
MASKPRLIPSIGPRKLIKTRNEGRLPSETVNSFRKKKEFSGSFILIDFPMLVSEVAIDPKQVRAMITIKIMNLQLRT